MRSALQVSLTVLNSRIILLKKRLEQPTDSNVFLITVTSLVKFDGICFARYNSVLLEFPLYILGMFDVYGIVDFVFFLCPCVLLYP